MSTTATPIDNGTTATGKPKRKRGPAIPRDRCKACNQLMPIKKQLTPEQQEAKKQKAIAMLKSLGIEVGDTTAKKKS